MFSIREFSGPLSCPPFKFSSNRCLLPHEMKAPYRTFTYKISVINNDPISKQWKKSFPDQFLVSVFERYEKDLNLCVTKYRAEQHPHALINYFKVAQVMHSEKCIPIVHGQSRIWRVPQRILEFLGFQDLKQLRPSPDRFKKNSEILESLASYQSKEKTKRLVYKIFGSLPPKVHKKSHPDHQPHLMEHLLSGTVGLFHCEFDESALSLVFGGAVCKYISCEGNRSIVGNKKSKKIANSMIQNAMKLKGIDLQNSQQLFDQLEPLYQEAMKAKIGQLIIIGVPFSLVRETIYQSHPFGLPTGHNIEDVINSLVNSKLPKGGCQVRLMLSQETLNPKNGIKVINVMDHEAVAKYTKGKYIESSENRKIFENLLKKQGTFGKEKEILEQEHFEKLKQEIDQVCLKFFKEKALNDKQLK